MSRSSPPSPLSLSFLRACSPLFAPAKGIERETVERKESLRPPLFFFCAAWWGGDVRRGKAPFSSTAMLDPRYREGNSTRLPFSSCPSQPSWASSDIGRGEEDKIHSTLSSFLFLLPPPPLFPFHFILLLDLYARS